MEKLSQMRREMKKHMQQRDGGDCVGSTVITG